MATTGAVAIAGRVFESGCMSCTLTGGRSPSSGTLLELLFVNAGSTTRIGPWFGDDVYDAGLAIFVFAPLGCHCAACATAGVGCPELRPTMPSTSSGFGTPACAVFAPAGASELACGYAGPPGGE